MTTTSSKFNPNIKTPTLPLSNINILTQPLIIQNNLSFRTAYGPKLQVPLHFPPDEGRTKQSFKDECDINQIMARYERTGVIEFTQQHEPQYADCTGIDFQRGQDIIVNATAMFMALPAAIRSKFNNKPIEFLDFVQNPINRPQCEAMGLLAPEPKQATPLAEPSKPAAGAPGEAPEAPKQGSKGKKPADPE